MSRLSRRRLLAGGALTAGGAMAGAAVALARDPDTPTPAEAGPVAHGTQTVPFHGVHQAGIDTPAQAHAAFCAFDLAAGVDRAALGRLMRLLTDDAARLTQGRPALADTEPELAALPARLTVTFGFGPRFFAAAGREALRPESVAPLPAFGIDRLEQRWCGGDLLVQVCADDPLTVTHAQRMLVKDTLAFARPRWTQRGFRRGRGTQDDGVTQRNVMGQLDGTRNPALGSPEFDGAVWVDSGPSWLHGGTTLVVRRIRAEMEKWDAVDTAGKEFAVGRRLDTGAPLSGEHEHDPPDYAATNALGLTVIAEAAHIARAHVDSDRQRIFRRPYNYDEPPGPDGRPDMGLVFAAYQRDVGDQFLPIQRNLAEADLMNDWITPIGSAVFAVPPGCQAGGWIGETLLT
ncbi:Dyp-type peroxidase [Phytohabitans sp. ZYX-F-186]|uniref:Dyp-type peroxidase n=1 Tax=Phytohabitans maris TaxID=3071409 RepID=A0ABU0ZT54_9ACTN|nr:Dyp-type peroxidase [Phytohabitans sp. ZYX-F-186]MDQ7909395.1 Dyp-type peroxidase [Phytohabitans sp. ZYX-F-186]